MHPYLYCNIIYNSQEIEATQVPISRQVDKKLWYIYAMEHYQVIKKEYSLTICNNMDGPRVYHTKWNKSALKRQIRYDFTYMWNLKRNINEQTKQKQTHR